MSCSSLCDSVGDMAKVTGFWELATKKTEMSTPFMPNKSSEPFVVDLLKEGGHRRIIEGCMITVENCVHANAPPVPGASNHKICDDFNRPQPHFFVEAVVLRPNAVPWSQL